MTSRLLAAALCTLLLTGCFEQRTAAGPAPQEPGPTATGYICQMNLAEHAGPKGQIFLRGEDNKALWFTSVRQVFEYMHMDGENHAVSAIYVNDMGRSTDWDRPAAGAWVDARKATYVIGSDKTASMGGGELVPFKDPSDAQAFIKQHGGHAMAWTDIPKQSIAVSHKEETHGQGH